ncbi:MAG: nitrate reductase cytochrome c-type subunit [bacterium]|nr:nitrate reductase cytochrome c-type subunit [bacterium]
MKVTATIFLALGFLLAACSSANQAGCQSFSLRQDCLSKTAKPLPAPVYSSQGAGESQLLVRSFATAPPQIPHDMEGLPVTREANMCLTCHYPGGSGVPGLPASHRSQPKIALGHTQGSPQYTRVTGREPAPEGFDQARYFCNQCHVPQAGNLKPLVENQF